MTDPQIRDALNRIIPENLDATGLADGAHRKRRQRSRALAAGACLAVLALAVPLALNLTGVNRPMVATPEQSTSGSPPAVPPSGIPEACAQDWDALPANKNLGSLPAGAARAWLCGDANQLATIGQVGPLEPLTTDVDKVVTAFKALAVGRPETAFCTEEYRLTYRVVLEYDAGEQRVVTGELQGCGFVNDDSGDFRKGASAYFTELVKLWQAQRKASGKEVVGDTVGCSASTPIMPMTAADAVRGSACRFTTSPSGERVFGAAARLPPELFARVKSGLAEAPDAPAPSSDPTDFSLTLANRFGDTQTYLLGSDGVFSFQDRQICQENNPAICTDAFRAWKPEPEVLAQLKALGGDGSASPAPPATITSAVPPSSSPGQGQTSPADPGTGVTQPSDPVSTVPPVTPISEPTGCAGAAEGTLVSTSLPGGKLPDGPLRVWLCAKGGKDELPLAQVGPWEPLIADSRVLPGGARNVTLAADSFNALEASNPNATCSAELGPAYLVVFEYTEGKRSVIEVQPYGCGAVIAGEQQLTGGKALLDGLVKLWESQRAELPAKADRPGQLCPSLSSILQPTLINPKLARAAVCNTVNGVAKETALAPDVVAGIAAGLNPPKAVNGSEPGRTDQTLVVVNEAGDPVTLTRLLNGSFTWAEGDRERIWTPTGKLAEDLSAAFES